MSSFTKSTAKTISGLFIGVIVISFIFTFDSSLNTGLNTKLGKVGSDDLEIRDYENEYNFQLRMLSFQTGGQQLTSEQIELFKVRERAFESLVSKKLLKQFSMDSGIIPGAASIRNNIREQEVFQTNKQFDLVKYKSLLEQNRYTPSGYEEITKEGIQVERAQGLLQTNIISKSLAKDLLKIKENKIKVTGIQVRESDFNSYIEISDSELNEFLSKEENKNSVMAKFNTRKPTLDKPEEVLASHILLKGDDAEKRIRDLRKRVNPSNFAKLAKETSEGPSKTKGGDLGWFGKGRMVKEFEDIAFTQGKGSISDPVKTQFGYHLIYVRDKKESVEAKYEDYEKEIATQTIQATKNKEAKKLYNEVTQKLISDKSKNNWETISKKYSLNPYYEIQINRLNPRLGVIEIKGDDAEKLFSLENGQDMVINDANRTTVLVKNEVVEGKEIKDEDVTRERNSLARALSGKFADEFMNTLWSKYSVKCADRTLNSRQEIAQCGL